MRVALVLLIIALPALNAYAQNDVRFTNISREIHFRNKSVRLNQKAKRLLDSLALLYKADTALRISLSASYADMRDKCGNRAWDRIQSTADYFIKAGVDSAHILLKFIELVEANTVIVSIELLDMIDNFPPPRPPVGEKSNFNDDLN